MRVENPRSQPGDSPRHNPGALARTLFVAQSALAPVLGLRKEPGVTMDFLGQWWVMAVMAGALIGLVVLMLFLRNRPSDDE